MIFFFAGAGGIGLCYGKKYRSSGMVGDLIYIALCRWCVDWWLITEVDYLLLRLLNGENRLGGSGFDCEITALVEEGDSPYFTFPYLTLPWSTWIDQTDQSMDMTISSRLVWTSSEH